MTATDPNTVRLQPAVEMPEPPPEPEPEPEPAPAPKPAAKKKATKAKTKKPAAQPRTVKLEAPDMVAAPAERAFWYWCGALPSLESRSGCDIAGISFPKLQELFLPRQPNESRLKRKRLRVPGSVVRLTTAQLDRLCTELPRLILRRLNVRPERVGDEGVGDAPRCATAILRVPKPEELEAMRGRGDHRGVVNRYVPQEHDRWLAETIYCKFLPGRVPESRPMMRDKLPPPISESGIQYPPEDAEPAADRGLTESELFPGGAGLE